MGVDHPGLGFSLQDLVRMVRREALAALQNSSIGRAGLRIYDGGVLLIEDGGLSITGTATVTGTLTGSGSLKWTGPSLFEGTVNVTGNSAFGGTLSILGATTIGGLVTLNNDLSLGTGRILAGPVIIDRSGPSGGRIRSTGQLILGDATGAVYIDGSTTIAGPLGVTGFTNLQGLDVSGPKNFKMEHPSKPGHWLRHGATESPVSGTEYTGRATIGADGTVTVTLPDYFEALNKPENRTAQVTPVGQPFLVGASDIEDGRLTIYGTAGRDVYWLVKAERIGGDFLLEEPIPDGQ